MEASVIFCSEEKNIFTSPKKLRKGTVLFSDEIQTRLVTVWDRLLKELGLAPKAWLIYWLPGSENWYQEITPDQLIVIICQKQESPRQGKNSCSEATPSQLMKKTAQQPEGMKKLGSWEVTDRFGTQEKRSMTSVVKLCYIAFFWSKNLKPGAEKKEVMKTSCSQACFLVYI